MSKKYIIKKYNYENNSYLTIGSYDSWKETKAFLEKATKEKNQNHNGLAGSFTRLNCLFYV